MDYEIGHINIMQGDELWGNHESSWHKDSYPFVCITMLSDDSTTVGGELEVNCDDMLKFHLRTVCISIFGLSAKLISQ